MHFASLQDLARPPSVYLLCPQSPPHQVLPSRGLQVTHSPAQVLQPDLSPPSLPPAALLRPACPWHRPSTAGNKQVHCLSAAATVSVCSVNTIMLSTARQPLPAAAIEPIHHPVSARVGYLQVGRGKCTGANLTLYSCSIFNKLRDEIAVHERSCLPGLEQILEVREDAYNPQVQATVVPPSLFPICSAKAA